MYTKKKYDKAGEAARAILYSHYTTSSKRRGITFELSQDEALELFIGNCEYCGQPPSQRATTNTRIVQDVFLYNGIDRVNNEEGYTVKNCVSCCKTCNYAKSGMSQDEFIAWIVRTYNHLSRG